MYVLRLKRLLLLLNILSYDGCIGPNAFDPNNFGLVSSLLNWILRRLSPDWTDVVDLETIESRANFIALCACELYSLTDIKLNPKSLLLASNAAIPEILKVVEFMFSCFQEVDAEGYDEKMNENLILGNIEIMSTEAIKIKELAESVTVNLKIVINEADKRKLSLRQMNKIETSSSSSSLRKKLERKVQDDLKTKVENVEADKTRCLELEQEKRSLSNKLKKKYIEVERARKRLDALSRVKPKFMDEFELLEREMVMLFETYSTKVRNIAFLEQRLKHKKDVKGIAGSPTSTLSSKESLLQSSTEVSLTQSKDLDEASAFNANIEGNKPVQESLSLESSTTSNAGLSADSNLHSELGSGSSVALTASESIF